MFKVLKKLKTYKLLGFLMLFINGYYLFHFIVLFYKYFFTDILFFYMYPTWILILNIFIGITGVIISFKLIQNQIRIRKALLLDILVLLPGFLISYFYPLLPTMGIANRAMNLMQRLVQEINIAEAFASAIRND
jgi:hypothetical protein